MKKQLAIITVIAVISLLWISTEAFSGVPSWMDPFANPRPVYKYDWAFGTGRARQGEDGKWYNIGLEPYVGKSAGDGTGYTGKNDCYWTAQTSSTRNDQLNGFSLSNGIGDWIDAIGSGRAVIRYSIREELGASLANSDIVELDADGVETLIKHGRDLSNIGVYDTFGVRQDTNITALEWNDFDDENMAFDHVNSINSTYYRDMIWVDRNMDDETVYMTWGAEAELDTSGDVVGTTRSIKSWAGTHNGYSEGFTVYYITTNPDGIDENLGDPTFDGTNWFLPVTVSATTYSQRMDVPYDEANYPASSGAVIQWYDDYDLYLAGAGISNPGGYGVSGRYVLERDEFLYTGPGKGYAHHADVCWESRTYNPIRNADGPESPYEWVYDASGDMYVPTDGSGLPGDTEAERAFKLIGVHPYWVDDDTNGELEWRLPDNYEFNIWGNQETSFGSKREGVIANGLFVDSWRLAGFMLGQDFWNDDPAYVWSAEIGAVAERIWAVDLVDIDWFTKVPVWTWDSVASEWELPDTYDKDDSAVMDSLHVWDWVNDYTDTPVAGYDELNNFMKYVFDIDALVVEDANGDGEFDVGDDYVLFSVVDDGLYYMYQEWGIISDSDTNSFFGGHYFDGDTVFLYDGTSVITYFDAAAVIYDGTSVTTGIFFGQAISTAIGFGTGQTLWSMYDIYDLDALDIGIVPEPSTLLLLAPALLGIAGVLRRRIGNR